ncbi:MAG: hypothetical protein ABSC76_11380 [Terracidiphilus sp.]
MTAIVMSKTSSFRSGALLLLACGLGMDIAHAAPQHAADPSFHPFPTACFFLKPNELDHSANRETPPKEQDYRKRAEAVYRLWCKPNASTIEAKLKAADAMAASWKRLWDEDEPYDVVFHETGAFDLLVLMGITHQLPAPMADDLKFTQMWIEDCTDTCFTIWGVPENAADEHRLAMELRLRNDVLDNLKKEPASEPVVQMLLDARFRLVD